MSTPAITFLFVFLWPFATLAQDRWPMDHYDHQITPYDCPDLPSSSDSVAIIVPESVGLIRLDMTVADIERVCPHRRYGWYGGDEAIFEPVILVKFRSTCVLVELEDTLSSSHIRRIFVGTPGIPTSFGVGVGSQVRELAKMWGKPRQVEIECVLYLSFPNQPGIAVEVSLPVELECGERESASEDLINRSRIAKFVVFQAK